MLKCSSKVRPSTLADYKWSLLSHPIALELTLAFTNFSMSFGMWKEGFPPVLFSYTSQIPEWVWVLYFAMSGITFLIGFNQAFIGRRSRMLNAFLSMFLWIWLSIGVFSKDYTAVSYAMLSIPISCSWLLAHLLFQNSNDDK